MGAQLLCHCITKETAFAADDDWHVLRQAVRRFQDRRLFFMLCTGNGTVIKGIAIPHIIKQVAARLQCQKAEGERDRAEERAKDAENQLAGSRQMAEAAKLRGDKLKAENDALKKQPITTVVDKEEVERQAREMAAEMTADLRAQLEQAASGSEQDAHSSYDNVLLADRSFQNIGKMVISSLRKLPQEQREAVANQLIRTLGQIQGEVSQCL